MANTWKLSDGTVVQLGGEVTGTGRAARQLRDDLADLDAGEWVGVTIHPEPAEEVELDVDSPQHIHAWVVETARSLGVEVLEHPEIEWPAPQGDDDDDDAIY